MVGVAYAMVKVPKVENADATVQGSTVYYSDKHSILTKIGSSRTIVKFNQISVPMQTAALAAEDRNFYNESAISPTGIARAVVNDAFGGDTQGGSTITQQYVKNAYLTQQRTLTRKFKEIFIAVKVGKEQDKQTILQNYLNTIFFGRHAYGVEAAAEAYYGVHASQLTVPQAAVLAATIKQPGYYDPRSTGQQHIDALERYDFVLDGMVKMGKLSQTDYAKYKDHPAMTLKVKDTDTAAGQKGYLIQRVKNAMHNMGYTDTELETQGLKIYTTWDKNLQAKAKQAVENKLRQVGMPSDTRVGLVSINPNNGEIVAAYGGKDYLKRFVDDGFYATAQVGSGFKPYVLATALTQNIGLKSDFDGSGPAWFDTNGDRVHAGSPGAFEVHNDEANPANPIVDLVTATAESLNTVYVPLGYKAGTQNVFQLAQKAGLPADAMQPHLGQSGFFLGQASMTPLQQATGYATMANDGTYIRPHTIRKVLDAQGRPFHEERWKDVETHQAFDANVAHDLQFAMQAVVHPGGTGYRAALPGRQVAGKTGTTNDNLAAWFNGFTPHQLVTTVGMWRYDDAITKGKHKRKAVYKKMQGVGGLPYVNGGDFPAEIWHDYMSAALQGKQVTTFPPPANVGENTKFATPSPPPSPSTPPPGQLPPCQQGQDPTFDHCRPSDGGDNGGDHICRKHPDFPQCQGQPTDPPPPNCGVLTRCPPTSPPPNNGPNSAGAQKVTPDAARPTRD